MTLPENLHKNTVVVRAEGMVATDMDGQWVMMSVENGKYYSLDPVGSRIWDLIERPFAIKDIVCVLLSEYKVAEKQCRTDVALFLNDMIERGLVDVV